MPGDVGALGQQPARVDEVLRSPHSKGGDNPLILQVPGGELPLVSIASPQNLVPALRGPNVLQARPVSEIAEEVGHLVKRPLLAQHRFGDVPPLLEGYIPMLDSQPPTVKSE